MTSFYIFLIRLFLSVGLAFLIGRFFFDKISVVKISGLAVVLLGFAYLFEYTKKRDKG
jgi:hypothetical protein